MTVVLKVLNGRVTACLACAVAALVLAIIALAGVYAQ
jgi:hypothetical protein